MITEQDSEVMESKTQCLKCQRIFVPAYRYNRICAKCQKDNEKVRDTPKVPVVTRRGMFHE